MFKDTKAFSGFSVDDLSKAEEFYGQTLGLDCDKTAQGLMLHIAGGGEIFIYPKPNHTPASYTVLNFPVDDIDKAVAALIDAGVKFEHYKSDMLQVDEKGIARGRSRDMGPDIAWFTDPAGNILSVLQQD